MATNAHQPRDWETLYQLAILESDPIKLPARIADARHAIIEQLATKPYNDRRNNDWQTLNGALAALHVACEECERKLQQFGEKRNFHGLFWTKR
jgi:hypothetical protein